MPDESIKAALDAIERLTDEGKPLYRTASPFPPETRLFWEHDDGPDHARFFRLAEAVGAQLFYWRTENESERGGPDIVEVAFLCDGFFHILRVPQIAPQELAEVGLHGLNFTQGTDDDDDEINDWDRQEKKVKEEDKVLSSKLAAEGEEVAAGFIAFLREVEKNFDARASSLGWPLRKYLSQSGGYPEQTHDFPKLDRAIENIARSIAKEIAEHEKTELKELVPEVVDWAKDNGLRTLNLSDVEVFLDSKEAALSNESRKKLWQQTKFELKAKR